MKRVKLLAVAVAMVAAASGSAMAYESSQINIPSTDAKGLKEVTIGVNSYARFATGADAGPNTYDIGITTGLLPYEKVKIEVGADYGTYGAPTTKQPLTYNSKLATAEDALFTGMPAFAVGGYNLGNVDPNSNAQNILYALVARTFPVVGRLSVGGYNGDKTALGSDHNGVLASWDRSITEVSDKLWLGIDYMSGNNADGEVSFGGSWAFSKQITLLTGVTFYNKIASAGRPTFTTQLSINLP